MVSRNAFGSAHAVSAAEKFKKPSNKAAAGCDHLLRDDGVRRDPDGTPTLGPAAKTDHI